MRVVCHNCADGVCREHWYEDAIKINTDLSQAFGNRNSGLLLVPDSDPIVV